MGHWVCLRRKVRTLQISAHGNFISIAWKDRFGIVLHSNVLVVHVKRTQKQKTKTKKTKKNNTDQKKMKKKWGGESFEVDASRILLCAVHLVPLIPLAIGLER